MASKGKTFLCLHVLLLLLTTATPSPTPSPSGDDAEFIRSSCGATLYPDLCFNSLSRNADGIHHDPLNLAILATNLSRYRVRALLSRVSALYASSKSNPQPVSALKDCEEVLGDAADGLSDSEAELERLKGAAAGSLEAKFMVSNAQTWMSAALTNEDTCEDGLDGVEGGGVKDAVRGGVRRAKQFTSNALALVNRLSAAR